MIHNNEMEQSTMTGATTIDEFTDAETNTFENLLYRKAVQVWRAVLEHEPDLLRFHLSRPRDVIVAILNEEIEIALEWQAKNVDDDDDDAMEQESRNELTT